MQIDAIGLLTQLGYQPTDTNLNLLETIKKNTPSFETIQKHILALHDHLKTYDGFVALSSSNPYLKIKIDTQNPSHLEIAIYEIEKWAQKYRVKLKKVKPTTFYILGI